MFLFNQFMFGLMMSECQYPKGDVFKWLSFHLANRYSVDLEWKTRQTQKTHDDHQSS